MHIPSNLWLLYINLLHRQVALATRADVKLWLYYVYMFICNGCLCMYVHVCIVACVSVCLIVMYICFCMLLYGRTALPNIGAKIKINQSINQSIYIA